MPSPRGTDRRWWSTSGCDQSTRPVPMSTEEIQRSPVVMTRVSETTAMETFDDSAGMGTVATTAAVSGSTTCSGPSTVPYRRRPSVVKRTAPARSVASCAA